MNYDQNILFLCNHNSARSQMAEGLLKALGDDKLTVFSAGLDPRAVDPGAIAAMGEIGIDISNHQSKSTKEFLGKEKIHQAIFLCSEDESDCPRIFPFAQKSIEWRIPAPGKLAEEKGSETEAFREVRELIDRHIRSWHSGMKQETA